MALGEELSIHLFHSNPGYLSSAFAVGSQRVVSAQSVAIAIAGGMLAASVAVLSPLKDIVSRQPLAAITDKDGAGTLSGTRWLALGGVACLAAATAILLAAPKSAVLGMVFLVGALLLLLPIPLNATLALVRRIAPGITSAVPHVAVMELRAGRARAVAIAATGAVAVFGSVAIEAAHGDLLHGLENAAHDMNAFTDVWVSPAGTYNLLRTTPFAPTDQAKLASLPGVSAVRLYRGGLLDIGERRVWVIAPPRESTPLLPASQIVEGNVAQAEARGARRRLGGGVAGDRRRTPPARRRALRAAHPRPEHLQGRGDRHQHRLGAGRDHHERRRLRARVGLDGRERLQRAALARRLPGPGQARDRTRRSAAARALRCRPPKNTPPSSARSAARASNASRQIATLILIAAVLAMAAAMGNMVWQRRPRLAKLKLEGFPRAELWRTILLESLLLLGVGCVSGAVFGLYGQQLLDRALANVINFPVVYSFGILVAHRQPRAGDRRGGGDRRDPGLHRRRRAARRGAARLSQSLATRLSCGGW